MGIDIAKGKLVEANNLENVIDVISFNDEEKLGKGKEMVDQLTDLIPIFEQDGLNFRKNKAEGNDILGDAYEYLIGILPKSRVKVKACSLQLWRSPGNGISTWH